MLLASRIACATALLAFARIASAEEVPLRLDLSAAPCIDGAAFGRDLVERQPTLRPVTSDERLVVIIAMTGVPPDVRGRISFVERGHAAHVRELAAASCEELVPALVLVTALAYDSWRAEARAPAVEPADTPARSSSPELATGARAAPTRPTMTSGDLGVFGAVRTFGTPNFAPGVGARLSALRGARAWLRQEGGLLGTVSFVHSSVPAASAVLGLVSLEACPIGVPPGAVDLSLCGAVAVGAFIASADAVVRPTPRVRPWIEPSLGARLRVTGGSAVGFVSFVGAAVPLVRDELVVEGAGTAFSPFPVSFIGHAGLVATIW